MITNTAGVELIKRHEGLRLEAYLCPAKVWTIGYGHTGADVKRGQRITEHQADVILALDLERFESGVESITRGLSLNENEFSALVSFAFNVGLGRHATSTGLDESTLMRKLRAGDRVGASLEFARWVRAEGEVLPGLVRRREEERALFMTPVLP